MKNLISRAGHLVTTFFGLILGSPSLVDGIQTGDKEKIILGAGTIIMGLLSKDK